LAAAVGALPPPDGSCLRRGLVSNVPRRLAALVPVFLHAYFLFSFRVHVDDSVPPIMGAVGHRPGGTNVNGRRRSWFALITLVWLALVVRDGAALQAQRLALEAHIQELPVPHSLRSFGAGRSHPRIDRAPAALG
jgi:hypothetical protein